jgi:hypothetical protein
MVWPNGERRRFAGDRRGRLRGGRRDYDLSTPCHVPVRNAGRAGARTKLDWIVVPCVGAAVSFGSCDARGFTVALEGVWRTAATAH